MKILEGLKQKIGIFTGTRNKFNPIIYYVERKC